MSLEENKTNISGQIYNHKNICYISSSLVNTPSKVVEVLSVLDLISLILILNQKNSRGRVPFYIKGISKKIFGHLSVDNS